jgi:hypothetical protein
VRWRNKCKAIKTFGPATEKSVLGHKRQPLFPQQSPLGTPPERDPFGDAIKESGTLRKGTLIGIPSILGQLGLFDRLRQRFSKLPDSNA